MCHDQGGNACSSVNSAHISKARPERRCSNQRKVLSRRCKYSLEVRYCPQTDPVQKYRVGVNPYVLHYQTSIFGDDAEDFNPDRWFRPDAAVMDRYMFQFGSGTRVCIGKNVALIELHKFLPQFLRSFNVELVDPEREWKEHNTWFVKQTDIDCRVSKRAF
jgi:hypothetical protein